MERYRRLLQQKKQEESNKENVISATKSSTTNMSDWGDEEPTETGRSFGGGNEGYGGKEAADDGEWGAGNNTSNGGGGGRREFGNRNGAEENVYEGSMRDLHLQKRVIPSDFEKETFMKFIKKDLPELQSKGNYIDVLCAQSYLKQVFKSCLESEVQKRREKGQEATVETEFVETIATTPIEEAPKSTEIQELFEDYIRELPQFGRQEEAQLSPERLDAINEKRRKAAEEFWRQKEQNEPGHLTMLQRQLTIRRDREERGFGNLTAELEPHNENFTIADLENADRRRLATMMAENGDITQLQQPPQQQQAIEPEQATAVPAETFHIKLRQPRRPPTSSQQLQSGVVSSSAEETESVVHLRRTRRSTGRQQRTIPRQYDETFMRGRTEFSRFTTRPIPQRSTLMETISRRNKEIGFCCDWLGDKAVSEWNELTKFKEWKKFAKVDADNRGEQVQAVQQAGNEGEQQIQAQQAGNEGEQQIQVQQAGNEGEQQVQAQQPVDFSQDEDVLNMSVREMRDDMNTATSSEFSSKNLPRLPMQQRSAEDTPTGQINRMLSSTPLQQVEGISRRLLDSLGGIANEDLQQQTLNMSLQSIQNIEYSIRDTSTPTPQAERQQGQTAATDGALEIIIEQCETENERTIVNNQVSLPSANIVTVQELPPPMPPPPTPTCNNIQQPNNQDIERDDWFTILRARDAPVSYAETDTRNIVPIRRRRRRGVRRAPRQNNNLSQPQFINPLPGILPEPPMSFDELPPILPPIAPTVEVPLLEANLLENVVLAAGDPDESSSITTSQPHLPLGPSNDVSQVRLNLSEAQRQHENFLLENAEAVSYLTNNADLFKNMMAEYAKHCEEGSIQPNHFSETYDPELILQMDPLRLTTKLYMLEELTTSSFFDFHRLRRLATAEEKAIAWEFLEDLCRCGFIEIFDDGHKVSLK